MSEEKRFAGMIDLAPTWEGVLQLYVEVATRGEIESGRVKAWEELRRMARIADSVKALQLELESLRAFKRGVDEALNSGDGSYRP